MFGYRVPAPDEAMLISGGRRGMNDAPFRVVTGHGAFVTPFFRKGPLPNAFHAGGRGSRRPA